jgi:CheY-like chemotaxis protein
VLLVEDNETILDLGKMMLERLGYAVLAAGTIKEAIRMAEESSGNIDILITDVVMPEMNGRELVDRGLRKRSVFSGRMTVALKKSIFHKKDKF